MENRMNDNNNDNGNFDDFMKAFYEKYYQNMKVTFIPVSGVFVGKYQKKLDERRARTIAENFDPHRMRPIEVSERNGGYWVWDGQTRLRAHVIMGLKTIPAIVHKGMTYEDDARHFANQNDNVGAVQTIHKWNALVEAKDPTTLEIVKVAKRWGFEIKGSVSSAKSIAAIKTIQDVVRDSGVDGLSDLLGVVHASWEGKDVYNKSKPISPTNISILNGIHKVLRTYVSYPDFKKDRLVHILALTNPTNIYAKASGNNGNNAATRVAKEIVKMYNSNLRKDKLPDLI